MISDPRLLVHFIRRQAMVILLLLWADRANGKGGIDWVSFPSFAENDE
jgi:hypothetical protein